MTTKQVQLRKKFVKFSIISASIFVVLLALSFFIENYDNETLSERSTKQSDNDAISSEYNALTIEYGLTKTIKEAYDNYIKSHNPSFVLDREYAAKILKKLREKHNLIQLEMGTSKVDYLTDKLFKLRSGKVTKYEVNLKFSAMSDAFIYDLITSIKKEFAGIVLIHDLKIHREGELSPAYIANSLNSNKLTPLVTGSIEFSWLGISKDDSVNDNMTGINGAIRNGGANGR